MRCSNFTLLIAATCGLYLLFGSAFAQSSFEEGSFGDDATVTKPAGEADSQAKPTQKNPDQETKPQTETSGDTLVGSFDEPNPKEPETTVSGGVFEDEGSFVQDVKQRPKKPKVKPKTRPKKKPKQKKRKAKKPKKKNTVKPNNSPDSILAFEFRDFGVRPTRTLRRQQMHAPTPTAVPAGKLVSTANLYKALKNKQKMILIDVLGGRYTLPSSYVEQRVGHGGTFNDRIQQQTRTWLNQLTNGNRGMAIVLFCSDPQCWLSYNASLRVINAGFTNVYWYRGGKRAWQMAGYQTVPTGF